MVKVDRRGGIGPKTDDSKFPRLQPSSHVHFKFTLSTILVPNVKLSGLGWPCSNYVNQPQFKEQLRATSIRIRPTRLGYELTQIYGKH